jgi:hypothetical protein
MNKETLFSHKTLKTKQNMLLIRLGNRLADGKLPVGKLSLILISVLKVL